MLNVNTELSNAKLFVICELYETIKSNVFDLQRCLDVLKSHSNVGIY